VEKCKKTETFGEWINWALSEQLSFESAQAMWEAFGRESRAPAPRTDGVSVWWKAAAGVGLVTSFFWFYVLWLAWE
jgi:hypothetical protein